MTKQILLFVCYLLTNKQNACVIEKHECSHISLTMTAITTNVLRLKHNHIGVCCIRTAAIRVAYTFTLNTMLSVCWQVELMQFYRSWRPHWTPQRRRNRVTNFSKLLWCLHLCRTIGLVFGSALKHSKCNFPALTAQNDNCDRKSPTSRIQNCYLAAFIDGQLRKRTLKVKCADVSPYV